MKGLLTGIATAETVPEPDDEKGEEGQVAAARAVLDAIKADDAKALAQALEVFCSYPE